MNRDSTGPAGPSSAVIQDARAEAPHGEGRRWAELPPWVAFAAGSKSGEPDPAVVALAGRFIPWDGSAGFSGVACEGEHEDIKYLCQRLGDALDLPIVEAGPEDFGPPPRWMPLVASRRIRGLSRTADLARRASEAPGCILLIREAHEVQDLMALRTHLERMPGSEPVFVVGSSHLGSVSTGRGSMMVTLPSRATCVGIFGRALSTAGIWWAEDEAGAAAEAFGCTRQEVEAVSARVLGHDADAMRLTFVDASTEARRRRWSRADEERHHTVAAHEAGHAASAMWRPALGCPRIVSIAFGPDAGGVAQWPVAQPSAMPHFDLGVMLLSGDEAVRRLVGRLDAPTPGDLRAAARRAAAVAHSNGEDPDRVMREMHREAEAGVDASLRHVAALRDALLHRLDLEAEEVRETLDLLSTEGGDAACPT